MLIRDLVIVLVSNTSLQTVLQEVRCAESDVQCEALQCPVGWHLDKEVDQCNGNWTHDYPFSNRYIEGVKILWDFMKTHPQQ